LGTIDETTCDTQDHLHQKMPAANKKTTGSKARGFKPPSLSTTEFPSLSTPEEGQLHRKNNKVHNIMNCLEQLHKSYEGAFIPLTPIVTG
jgi:hypothetical protein